MVWDLCFQVWQCKFRWWTTSAQIRGKVCPLSARIHKEMMHYLVSVVDQYLKETLIVQVNPDMVSQLEKAGLLFVGKDETGSRMEVSISLYLPKYCCVFKPKWLDKGFTSLFIFMFGFINYTVIVQLWVFYFCWQQIIELPNHPYFVGAQFHPEFKSRPGKPSALFLGMFFFPSLSSWLIVFFFFCPLIYSFKSKNLMHEYEIYWCPLYDFSISDHDNRLFDVSKLVMLKGVLIDIFMIILIC